MNNKITIILLFLCFGLLIYISFMKKNPEIDLSIYKNQQKELIKKIDSLKTDLSSLQKQRSTIIREYYPAIAKEVQTQKDEIKKTTNIDTLIQKFNAELNTDSTKLIKIDSLSAKADVPTIQKTLEKFIESNGYLKTIKAKDLEIENMDSQLSMKDSIIKGLEDLVQSYKENVKALEDILPSWYNNFIVGFGSAAIVITAIILFVK